MFEKGLKIRIGRGPFQEGTIKEFELLKKLGEGKNKQYSTLIYGRNGSGKTTICNAFNDVGKSDAMRSFDVSIVDGDNNEISDINDHLFVYSEKFIDENIKFKSEGLETIVLLGEDLEIDSKLNERKAMISEKETDLKKYDLSIYDNPKHALNPQSSWYKILSILKSEGNWATRKKQISSLSRNAPVNDSVINDIITNHKNRTTLEKYDSLFKDYLKIKANNTFCDYKLNELAEIVSTEHLELILKRTLEKKDDDQLAREIYDVIEKFGNNRLDEIASTFESSAEYCPYCFQKIDAEYKGQLIKRISQIISKEEEEFRNMIDNNMMSEYAFDSLPDIIPDKVKLEFTKNVSLFNKEVKSINNLLLEKKDKLYSSMRLENRDIITACHQVKLSIAEINQIIDKHNEDIKKIADIERTLHEYNNSLSWETIEKEYKTYQQNLELKKKNEQEVAQINQELKELHDEVKILESKKKNIDEAVKEINASLAYVFMSKDRLQISNNGNDKYIVLSRGKSVKAKDLSIGERNIISMCYFFSSIGKGKSAKDRFKDEYLICIDDPISSFDYDNKVGVYSYLRSTIHQILSGNMNIRFVLLTHNYEVAYNLDKILRDVYGDFCESPNPIMWLRLHEFNLSLENLRNGQNQYKKLLDGVFQYANGEAGELTDLTIGNAIRRVLETFSSFEFNKSMEFLNKKLDGNIDNPDLDIIKNYMYRVLVNNESHGMLSGYAYDEVEKFEMFTIEERRNTARLALILLKKLNAKHVNAYLTGKVEIIESWERRYSDFMN